jgi:hypothetical protein
MMPLSKSLGEKFRSKQKARTKFELVVIRFQQSCKYINFYRVIQGADKATHSRPLAVNNAKIRYKLHLTASAKPADPG